MILTTWFLTTMVVVASDYYVDNRIGSDALDGRCKVVNENAGPFRTIAKAVEVVQPGDAIHLVPTGRIYRESIVFLNKGGEPGKPITVDGHGAWLTGADHCAADGWRPYDDGEEGTLVRNDLAGKGPWFSLCIDEEMTWGVRNMDVLRPGEFCWRKTGKDNTVYFLRPKDLTLAADTIEATLEDGRRESLDPKLWHPSHSRNRAVRRHRGLPGRPTRVFLNGQAVECVEARRRLEPGQWTRSGKEVHYRPPAGKAIADVRMLAVPRSSIVALQGRLSDVTIQNLNAVYAANDGYNIHGAVKNARFLNCNAFYCFDEGFSSHDDCETVLDGAVYVHCDNGIANVNRCVSVTRNVVCDSARSVGILMTTRENPAPHTLENVILIDSPRQYSVTRASVDNLLIVRGRQAMGLGSEVVVKRATTAGSSGMMRLEKTSSVQLEDCLLAGPKGVVHVRAENPLALLKLDRVLFATGTRMEWGVKYPWQTQPMGEWLAQAGDIASECREMDLAFEETLLTGKLPPREATPTGCTPELYQRYLQYLRERDGLLRIARRMAWGD